VWSIGSQEGTGLSVVLDIRIALVYAKGSLRSEDGAAWYKDWFAVRSDTDLSKRYPLQRRVGK
jgi:hypothetical protein